MVTELNPWRPSGGEVDSLEVYGWCPRWGGGCWGTGRPNHRGAGTGLHVGPLRPVPTCIGLTAGLGRRAAFDGHFETRGVVGGESV